MKPRIRLAAAATAGLFVFLTIGPQAIGSDWYENRLLPNGGVKLLAAPEAIFVREIQSILASSPNRRIPNGTNSPAAAQDESFLRRPCSRPAINPKVV